ncbi:MAG: Trm112 family protein, partial [Myxococcales bacterium]|nr:Trm112 family protein [Myxococcales bacterium]
MSEELLEILVCPETKQPVQLASADVLKKLS